MSEDETQENPTQQTQNTQGTPETLEAIKAQLKEEKEARAAAQASLAEKDARIAELQAQLDAALSEAKQGSEATAAELASVKEAKDQAVAKYLTMAKALNPAIPEGIISGESIAEIDASVEKGQAIVEAVKKAMESEASQARVPAGAPTRGGISLEGLTPREKIAAGLTQKGGT
jgi:multidrug efflux pump subunit AcrA (membrane-fusion protein)